MKGVLVEDGKDVRDLGWIIPLSRKHSVFFPGVLADVMDRKRFFLIEVVEKGKYSSHLLEPTDLLVPSDHLREGHLSHPNHASPPGVGHVGPLQVVIQLGKTRAVGQPGSLSKYLVENLVLLFDVVFMDVCLGTENVDGVSGLGEAIFVEGVEEAQHEVAHVEASV